MLYFFSHANEIVKSHYSLHTRPRICITLWPLGGSLISCFKNWRPPFFQYLDVFYQIGFIMFSYRLRILSRKAPWTLLTLEESRNFHWLRKFGLGGRKFTGYPFYSEQSKYQSHNSATMTLLWLHFSFTTKCNLQFLRHWKRCLIQSC